MDKVTVFIPTNDAFKAAYPSGVPATCAADSAFQYQLAYHVLPLAYALANLTAVQYDRDADGQDRDTPAV